METTVLSVAQLGPGIGGLDWTIIIAFLGISTVCAFVAKGRQAGVRDFFLANRNLPWGLVCVSLIATEISAAATSEGIHKWTIQFLRSPQNQ